MSINQIFEAKDYEILNVFTQIDASFYIPIYQRKYNWSFKDEVLELINDLREFDKNSNDTATYYLGNIIVKAQKNQYTNKIEKFVLIDGQQRLTTILLLVNYLKYALINDVYDVNPSDRKYRIDSLEEILFSSKGTSFEERKLKIENEISDRILRKIFEYPNKNSDLKIENDSIKSSIYYQNFIGIKDELKISTFAEWEKWLTIIKRIRVAQISLGADDNEISVFESINSKGLKLNTLDLIKNYLFLISEKLKTSEDIKKKIDHIFSNFESLVSDKKTSKKDEKKINRFFSAFIAKEEFVDFVKDTKIIYKEFKTRFHKHFDSIDKFKIFLDKLEQSFNAYAELIDDAKLLSSSRNMNNVSKYYLLDTRMELYLPLFLIIYDARANNSMSREEEYRIYSLLDFHNIVLSFTGVINKDNRFFFQYIENEIKQNRISYNSLETFLIEKGNSGNKSGLTSFSDFESNFKKNHIYKIDRKTASYVLYRIENKMRETSGEFIEFKGFTLEHIFPQNDSKWQGSFDSLEYKADYINSIGNLTLLTQKLNGSVSNNSYDQKILKISDSSLKLNIELVKNYKTWVIYEDNNSPLERAKELFQKVCSIWNVDILKEVKNDDNFELKSNLINLFDNISIVNAFRIIMFDWYPSSISREELKFQTEKLFDFISDKFPNKKILFSRDKISAQGWMTERIHSNDIANKNSSRFEKEYFKRDEDNNYLLLKKEYEDILSKLKQEE